MFKFFILFLSIALNADNVGYEFFVDNPTMSYFYFDTFNAIASLFTSPEYLKILNLAFLVGGFFVFAASILSSGKTDEDSSARGNAATHYFKYTIAGTFLLIIILGKSNSELLVISEDKDYAYCSSTFDKNFDPTAATSFSVSLPGILPWAFSTFNQIGKGTTELAQSAYSSLSSDTSIINAMKRNSGVGESLVGMKSLYESDLSYVKLEYLNDFQDSTTFGHISNSYALNSGLELFFKDCITSVSGLDPHVGRRVNYAFHNTGNFLLTLDDLFVSNVINIYGAMGDALPIETMSIPLGVYLDQLLFVTTNLAGEEITGKCSTYYNDVLKNALNIDSESIMCHPALRTTLNPASVYLMTKKEGLTTVPNVKQMVINSAMGNFYSKSSQINAVEGQMAYAGAKTIANQAFDSIGSGAYMAEMLPYLQMGIRSILYAFFPFVFIIILLPGGFSVGKNFIKSLLWVELWSPVAAVLNLFMSFFIVDTYSQKYSEAGMSLANAGAGMTDSLMLAGVAGYLYAMVPGLTYLILEGNAVMLKSMFEGLTSSFAKNMQDSSIHKDLSDLSAAKAFNETSGVRKSLAAIESLAARGEGQELGAKMGQSFNLSGGTDTKYLERKSDFGKGTSNKNEDTRNYGQLDSNDIKSTSAASVGLAFSTKLNKLKTSGAIDSSGNVDQDKLNSLGVGIGGSEAVDLMAKDKVFKDIMGEGYTPKEAGQVLSNIAAGKKIGENSKELKFLQAMHQLNNPNAAPLTLSQASEKAAAIHKDISTTQAIEDVKEIDRNREIQSKMGLSSDIRNVRNLSRAAAYEENKKLSETQILMGSFSSGEAGSLDGLKDLAGYADFKGAVKGFETSLLNAGKNDSENKDKYDSLARGLFNKDGSINASGLMNAKAEASEIAKSSEVLQSIQTLDNQMADLSQDITTQDRARIRTAELEGRKAELGASLKLLKDQGVLGESSDIFDANKLRASMQGKNEMFSTLVQSSVTDQISGEFGLKATTDTKIFDFNREIQIKDAISGIMGDNYVEGGMALAIYEFQDRFYALANGMHMLMNDPKLDPKVKQNLNKQLKKFDKLNKAVEILNKNKGQKMANSKKQIKELWNKESKGFKGFTQKVKAQAEIKMKIEAEKTRIQDYVSKNKDKIKEAMNEIVNEQRKIEKMNGNGGDNLKYKELLRRALEGSDTDYRTLSTKISQGSLNVIKGLGRGVIVGMAIDYTVNKGYEMTDTGSVSHTGFGVAKGVNDLLGEVTLMAVADLPQLVYATAIGDKDYQSEQLQDIAHSALSVQNQSRNFHADVENSIENIFGGERDSVVFDDTSHVFTTVNKHTGETLEYSVSKDSSGVESVLVLGIVGLANSVGNGDFDHDMGALREANAKINGSSIGDLKSSGFQFGNNVVNMNQTPMSLDPIVDNFVQDSFVLQSSENELYEMALKNPSLFKQLDPATRSKVMDYKNRYSY